MLIILGHYQLSKVNIRCVEKVTQ